MIDPAIATLLSVSGAVIAILLLVIAFFLKRVLSEFDNMKQLVAGKIIDHETRIAIIERSGCGISHKFVVRSGHERVA